MKPREAVRFLAQLAHGCDYLSQLNLDWAEFSVWSIVIIEPRPWEAWRANAGELPPQCRFSALGLQPKWVDRVQRMEVESGATITNEADDPSLRQLKMVRSFCRVLYRLVTGADASSAATVFPDALSKTATLGNRSDSLLANCMAETGREPVSGALDLLKRICEREGMLDVLSGGMTYRSRTTARSEGQSRGGASAADSQASQASAAAEPAVAEPGAPAAPASSREAGSENVPAESGRQSEQSAWSQSEDSVRDMTRVSIGSESGSLKFAKRSTRPGWIISPYGSRREQRITGPKWKKGGEAMCTETRQVFRLPKHRPSKLEAIVIPGVFDRVKSPWVDPPEETPVPAGGWKPGADFDCELTGEALCMPQELEAPEAKPAPGEPGVVLLPFNGAPPCRVDPKDWSAGATLNDNSGQEFKLPETLPPLRAILKQRTGAFESPFAPGKQFELTALQWAAGPTDRMSRDLPSPGAAGGNAGRLEFRVRGPRRREGGGVQPLCLPA